MSPAQPKNCSEVICSCGIAEKRWHNYIVKSFNRVLYYDAFALKDISLYHSGKVFLPAYAIIIAPFQDQV